MVKARCIPALLILGAVVLGACAEDPADENLTPREKEGKYLFAQHCTACHSTQPNTVVSGPSLAGLATRAETRVTGLPAYEYIQQSIERPSAYIVDGFSDLMPSSLSQILTPEEIQQLVAYLLTIK